MIPDHITTFLWSERYTPLNYLVMRVNAGEEAWARNFMQKGDAAGTQPFDDEVIAKAARAEFSTDHLERCRRYPAKRRPTIVTDSQAGEEMKGHPLQPGPPGIVEKQAASVLDHGRHRGATVVEGPKRADR